jgi:hypothetical protein
MGTRRMSEFRISLKGARVVPVRLETGSLQIEFEEKAARWSVRGKPKQTGYVLEEGATFLVLRTSRR